MIVTIVTMGAVDTTSGKDCVISSFAIQAVIASTTGDGAITATSTRPTETEAVRTLEINRRPSVPPVPGFSQMAA